MKRSDIYKRAFYAAGVAYAIILSTLIVIGLGVGSIIYSPAYILLLPYVLLGRATFSRGPSMIVVTSFWITCTLMAGMSALVLYFFVRSSPG